MHRSRRRARPGPAPHHALRRRARRPTPHRPAPRRHPLLLGLALAVVLTACGVPTPAPPDDGDPPPPPAPDARGLEDAVLELVADGFHQPVAFTHATDGSGRAFVVERSGRVQVLHDGVLAGAPYLDLTGVVAPLGGGEHGLLGLAFHPDFAANGRLFVHYVDVEFRSTIAELRAEPPSAATVAPETLEVLLTVPSFGTMHYAGDLAFGGDGHLYATLGDSTTPALAQDTSLLNGSVIRLQVDDTGDQPYLAPADNPFVGVAGADEIWVYGLRNPFRFSFDALTGDMWVADVGQAAVEEVNLLRAGEAGGRNYGWPIMEGHLCYEPPEGCPTAGLTLPVLTYLHEQELGRSVIGGHVYRGSEFPGSVGDYVFGDFVSGNVFVATPGDDGWTMEVLLQTDLRIVAFGLDEANVIHVLDLDGAVHALVPPAPVPPDDDHTDAPP